MSNSTKVIEHNDDEIDLGQLFGYLVDNYKLILFITMLFAGAGVAVAMLSTPIYKADALVQVESKSSGMLGLADMNDLFIAESESITEIEIIKSRMVLGDVVRALDLTTIVKPLRIPVVGDWWARRNETATPSQWKGYALGGEQILVSKLQVPNHLLGQTLILELTSPRHFRVFNGEQELLKGEIGQEITANGVVIEVADLRAAEGTRFTLSKQDEIAAIADLQAQLAISEKGKQSGILSLSLQGEDKRQLVKVLNSVTNFYMLQNVKRMSAEAENSLTFVEQNLPQVKGKLDAAEAELNQFQSSVRTVDISLETEAILDGIVDFERRINELNIKENEIQQLYTQSHPIYQTLMKQRTDLEQQKSMLSEQVEGLPEVQQQLLRLRRDVEVAQTIYLQLLNRAQELAIVKASTIGSVRIIDEAVAHHQPVKPKKALIAVLATLLGGMLAVALVLVKAMLRRGVESPEQIEETGLSVYSTVIQSKFQTNIQSKQKKLPIDEQTHGKHALLALANPADLAIESLRSLRTSLHFAMLDARNNILMISGPSPGVGKSFISANLGAVIASSNIKVLLIDGDMRKGYMQRIVGSEWDNGLSDYLAGKIDIQEALRPSPIEGMDFIPRGVIPPNPAELLMQPRLKTLMDWASENYDLVIIDTPPILAVTDAAIVGALAGTSIMVVKHQSSQLKEIEYSVHRFAASGVTIKGVILNQLVRTASSYGSYSNSAYYQYEYSPAKQN